DRARDRLPDPPGGEGGEPGAAEGIELPGRLDEAGVPLLDQVKKRQPAVPVAFGDRDDEPEVGPQELKFSGQLLLATPAIARLCGAIVMRAKPTSVGFDRKDRTGHAGYFGVNFPNG